MQAEIGRVVLLLLAMLIPMLWLWYTLDCLLCKEDYVTTEEVTDQIADFLNENFKKGILYDLGSSRGGFAIQVSNKCSQLTITGIDNSKLRILISRIRGTFQKSTALFKDGDIFKMDVSHADVIYVYIPQILLPKLAAKLEKELRPEVFVITSTITFPDWKPIKTISENPAHGNKDTIFVYQAPFR